MFYGQSVVVMLSKATQQKKIHDVIIENAITPLAYTSMCQISFHNEGAKNENRVITSHLFPSLNSYYTVS